jgi:hypothetical protein
LKVQVRFFAPYGIYASYRADGDQDLFLVNSLLLTWPDGTRQEVQVDQVNTTLVIRQPQG